MRGLYMCVCVCVGGWVLVPFDPTSSSGDSGVQ